MNVLEKKMNKKLLGALLLTALLMFSLKIFFSLYGAQSGDNTLMGSVLRFVVLAAIMISARRLDWHTLGRAQYPGEAS
jgi:inner membrane protein involved in colicin E2 resistance